MTKFKIALASLVLLVASACQTTDLPSDLSPREEAALLYHRYNIVLNSVLAAVTNPLMNELPEVKAALKDTSSVATAAVSEYVVNAGNCVRAIDGQIVTAPDAEKPCDRRALTQVLSTARAALSKLTEILARHNIGRPE